MKLLPVKIRVAYKKEGQTIPYRDYELNINYNRQKDVFYIIDKLMKGIIKDFDLSAKSDTKRIKP